MQIAEAIKIARSIATQTRLRAATLSSHPFLDGAYVANAAAQGEMEAGALEAVCDKLEAMLAEQEANAGGD